GRASDVLDAAADQIAFRVSSKALRRDKRICAIDQRNLNACIRLGIVDGVDTAVADQGIVAGAAGEAVVVTVALEIIGEGRADQVLDSGELVAGGVAVVVAIRNVSV